jgi:hypothetical protein
MNVRQWSGLGLLVILSTALITAPAHAQGRRGARSGARNYDPTSVATIEATVQEVVLESGRGGGSGVHLVVQTEGEEPTVVHVAPQFYLSEKDVAYAAGDSVTVVGSKTVVDGEPALVAREIIAGGGTLVLRDDVGRPAWRGSGSRAAARGARAGGRGNGAGQRGIGRGYRGGRGIGIGRG